MLLDGKEKRQIAQNMAKQFLKYFKRDTLRQLRDVGLLRDKKSYSMGNHFVPALYQQIKLEMLEQDDKTAFIERSLSSGLSARALIHKKAIQSEMQRREDLKNEKRRKDEEAARAKDRRRERRMCLKEQKRIAELVDVLVAYVPQGEQKEYTLAMPVYDVRDYRHDSVPGIYTFGGLFGELIVTLTAFQETMQTRMEMPAFELKRDQVLKFFEEILLEGYPQEVCHLKLSGELLSERERMEDNEDLQALKTSDRLLKGSNLCQYGLKFLLCNEKARAGLSQEIIKDLFYALCKIHYYEPQEPLVPPEDE